MQRPDEPQPRPRPRPDQDAEGVRCPYCHGAVSDGTLRSVCNACSAVHHVACFAEHRGCATHGCGSTEARSVRQRHPELDRLECGQCKQLVDSGALVAVCACGQVLDVACFEARGGRCTSPVCKTEGLRLVGQAEAHATRWDAGAALNERGGKIGLRIGAVWLTAWIAALVIGWTVEGPPPLGVGLTFVGLAAAGLLGVWGRSLAGRRATELRGRARALRLARLDAPPPAAGPPKGA
ncbi:MAG: hypothetical protein R3F62_23385 [Planctomycetota bacterium]